jgi:hypothetical protein
VHSDPDDGRNGADWAHDPGGRLPPLGGTARIVATLVVVALGVIVLVVFDTRA